MNSHPFDCAIYSWPLLRHLLGNGTAEKPDITFGNGVKIMAISRTKSWQFFDKIITIFLTKSWKFILTKSWQHL